MEVQKIFNEGDRVAYVGMAFPELYGLKGTVKRLLHPSLDGDRYYGVLFDGFDWEKNCYSQSLEIL